MKFVVALVVVFTLANVVWTQPSALEQLSQAQNEFGLALFQELIKGQTLKNIFISPTSVALALAMTYNGAAGETKEVMAKVLKISKISDQEFNKANFLLQSSLTSQNKKLTVKIANSLWIDKSCKFTRAFVATNKKFYRAQLASLNFASPKAIFAINQWVKNATAGRIEKIAEELPEDVWAILINALYFKGAWQEAFEGTKTRPFYLLDGAEKSQTFLYKKGKFLYFENDELQAISIPYADGSYTMDIFLPRKELPIDKLIYSLTPERYLEWLKSLETREGEVYLPQFKLEYESSLKEALSRLGMEIAFDQDRADFTRMAITPIKGRIFIGDIKHKTFIEVTREGTEAAAVTGVFMEIKGVPAKPFTLVLDRPFLYMIRNNKTQSIVFIGLLTEPK
ncbi:MAG: serpin family protein [candidate division WOR-3 bacterium]